MDFQNIVKTIVGVMVAVIVVMAMAVPVISSMTDHTSEVEGIECRMDKVETAGKTISFETGVVTDSVYSCTVNGVTFSLGTSKDVLMLYGSPSTIEFQNQSIHFIDIDKKLFSTLSNRVGTITITDGTYTSSDGKTFTFDWLMLPVTEGGQFAKISGDTADVSNYECYWYGHGTTSTQIGYAYGDPRDPSNITARYAYPGNIIYLNLTIDKVQMTDEGGYSNVGPATAVEDSYSAVTTMKLDIVPIEVTQNKTTADTLIDLIPLLMIVGLMVAVVAAYYGYSRED